MRVKISTNPPLPPVRAWFPLAPADGETICALKTRLCASLSALGKVSPVSLQLSIDGFELLDDTELTVVRDGDLICIDVKDVPSGKATTWRTKEPASGPPPRKRRRSPSTASSTSDTESTTSSSSSSESDSESESGSEVSLKEKPPQAKPKPQPETFVPPGYGKPQTRARNLRRRLRRTYEREAPQAGPTTGANAVVAGDPSVEEYPTLMSLSLRNKNKAKNFKSLMNKPLPPKIVFGESVPRLVPPSERSSLPPNLFVTSVDVEAKEERVDEDVETMARTRWDTLPKLTRTSPISAGTLVGYKALGIDPDTFTPGEVLTVAAVEQCGGAGLVVRPMRAVSFQWSGGADAEEHAWEEIEGGDWRVIAS